MKRTSVAPANIAFIKYWGKRDEALRIPTNNSFSMNLSGAYTTTTVDFSDEFKVDEVSIIDGEFSEAETWKVIAHLDRVRDAAKISDRARVETKNSFPKGTGIASSASGFAALTVAAASAAGLKLSEKELSILARLGSGSACRSIPDGFVEWVAGSTNENSFAYSVYPHEYWDLRDIVAVVSEGAKSVTSTGGMQDVRTSPLWEQRLSEIPARIEQMKRAFKEKNFTMLGELIEADCLSMHAVMQSQAPPLQYWTDATKRLMDTVRDMRASGIPAYFTIDAGPNVHVICEAASEEKVIQSMSAISDVRSIIVNKPAPGAHLISEHLF